MKTWQKWALGVALIVAAVAGLAVAWLDGDPNTAPDVPAALDQVRQGVETIKE